MSSDCPSDPDRPAGRATILHASCVCVDGCGVLILGQSGAGKSSLALRLMALGAGLVADDRTELRLQNGQLYAASPPPIRGIIEARGVGLLHADPVMTARVALAVDLDHVETERLPPCRKLDIAGQMIISLRKVDGAHFPEAIMQFLAKGRLDPS